MVGLCTDLRPGGMCFICVGCAVHDHALAVHAPKSCVLAPHFLRLFLTVCSGHSATFSAAEGMRAWWRALVEAMSSRPSPAGLEFGSRRSRGPFSSFFHTPCPRTLLENGSVASVSFGRHGGHISAIKVRLPSPLPPTTHLLTY